MKAYIVECGCYDGAYIAGVFSTPELAMAAYPEGEWRKTGESGRWTNGLDWDGRTSIAEYEIDGSR